MSLPTRFPIRTTGGNQYDDNEQQGEQCAHGGSPSTGSVTGVPIDATDHGDAALSPDGRVIAYTRDGHIHLYDLARRMDRRLTFEGRDHHNPVWSPDGLQVAFRSGRDEGDDADVYIKAANGQSPARPVLTLEGTQTPVLWLPGGRLVVRSRSRAPEPFEFLEVPVDGDADPTPFLPSVALARAIGTPAAGHLVAYADGPHILVRSLPDLGGPWQVSTDPAEGPIVWAPSGDALFYHDEATGALVRAELERGDVVEVRRRRTITDGAVGTLRGIHPDGRLLVVRQLGESRRDAGFELMVVGNWFTELLERVGGGE